MSQIFCPSCGQPNSPDAAFCGACGAGLSQVAPPRAPVSPATGYPQHEAAAPVARRKSMAPLMIGVVLLCAALAGAAAYMVLLAPMSADAYKAVAASNMTSSLRVYRDFAESSQGMTSDDGSVTSAQVSSTAAKLAQLKGDVDGLAQQTSKLRAPAEFKDTQQSLVSWLGALSEMLERGSTSLTAIKQGGTGAEVDEALYSQFDPGDRAVQNLNRAIEDAVPLAERLGVESGMIDQTIRSGSVSMPDRSEPSAQTDARTDTPTDAAPQLAPEQLQGGTLPGGHPAVGGGVAAMTQLPSGMTPEEALTKFNEDIIAGDFADAYKLLPLDKQKSYVSASAFGEQLKGYGVTGYKNGDPTTSGNDTTIVSTLETPAMPVTYTWTYTRSGGSWYVKSRAMGGNAP